MSENADKHVVKYDNEFNLTDLNQLKIIEQDIFFTVCSTFTAKKERAVSISLDTLMKRAKLDEGHYSQARFLDFVRSTSDKLAKIVFRVSDDEGYRIMPLFSEFFIPKGKNCLQVTLNDVFMRYFFKIPERISFSRFELEAFLGLNSKYAKVLFRHFLQNFTGVWIVDWYDFRLLAGFPRSYRSVEIFRLLDKVLPQLERTGYFSKMKYTVQKARRRGSPIESIRFTYRINKEKAATLEGRKSQDFEKVIETKTIKEDVQTIDPVTHLPTLRAKVTTVQQEKRCPKCGGAVVMRKDKNGHTYLCCENSSFWKTGTKDCDYREYTKDSEE